MVGTIELFFPGILRLSAHPQTPVGGDEPCQFVGGRRHIALAAFLHLLMQFLALTFANFSRSLTSGTVIRGARWRWQTGLNHGNDRIVTATMARANFGSGYKRDLPFRAANSQAVDNVPMFRHPAVILMASGPRSG